MAFSLSCCLSILSILGMLWPPPDPGIVVYGSGSIIRGDVGAAKGDLGNVGREMAEMCEGSTELPLRMRQTGISLARDLSSAV